MTTAKEFWREFNKEKEINNIATSTYEAMTEFAKFHVTAALKQAAENVEAFYINEWHIESEAQVDVDTVLNAYPLDNIK